MADTHLAEKGALYTIVIMAAPEEALAEITPHFAQAFNLLDKPAAQILKSVPVVFLSGLEKKEIRAVRDRLKQLSELGLEFKITPREVNGIPKVLWGLPPQFAVTPDGNLVNAVNFQWAHNAVTCPSCGEVFVFRPIGKPKLKLGEIVESPGAAAKVAAPAAKTTPPAAKAAPKPAPPAPAVKAPPSKPAGKGRAPAPEPVDEVLEVLDEPLELGETATEEPISLEEPLEAAEPAEIAEPSLDESQMLTLEEPIAAEEAPPPVKPGRGKPGAKTAAKKGTAPSAAESEPMIETDGGEGKAAPAKPEGITCKLFLSPVTDPSKKDAAAKLISEIRGCTLPEAKELMKRALVPVLKDVTEDEANAALEKFKKAKIQGRVTKRGG